MVLFLLYSRFTATTTTFTQTFVVPMQFWNDNESLELLVILQRQNYNSTTTKTINN